MKITVTAQISHLCPFVDEIDVGRVCIELTEPTELATLAAYLRSFKDQTLTHELMTLEIAKHTGGQVTTRWTTAGLDVEIRT